MKAVAYPRFSSDNQHEESIEEQLAVIHDYARNHDITIVREYIDRAESATTDDRPQFQAMISDIISGRVKVDYVLVHKTSRFARNRYHAIIYKEKLREKGVEVIAVTQPVSDGPERVITEAFYEAMDEYYSLNLSTEVKTKMIRHAQKGKHLGGVPPLGYDLDPVTRKYVVNQLEAEAVRLIFEQFNDGMGYGLIVEELRKRGYKTKTGKNFGKNSIHDILKNEKYTGTYIYNRAASSSGRSRKRNNHQSKPDEEIVRIPGMLPEIIPADLWRRTQEKMAGRKHTTSRRHGETVYYLTGKTVCGACESAYTGVGNVSGQSKIYYRLYRCVRKKQTRDCHNRDIRKEVLEAAVIKAIEDLFARANVDKLLADFESQYQAQTSDQEREYTRIREAIGEVEAKINRFLDQIEKGLNPDLLTTRLNALYDEQVKLKARLQELEMDRRPPLTKNDLVEFIRECQNDLKIVLENEENDHKTTAFRRLIDRYVHKVYIYADGIKVILKYSPPYAFNDGGGGPLLTLEAYISNKRLFNPL